MYIYINVCSTRAQNQPSRGLPRGKHGVTIAGKEHEGFEVDCAACIRFHKYFIGSSFDLINRRPIEWRDNITPRARPIDRSKSRNSLKRCHISPLSLSFRFERRFHRREFSPYHHIIHFAFRDSRRRSIDPSWLIRGRVNASTLYDETRSSFRSPGNSRANFPKLFATRDRDKGKWSDRWFPLTRFVELSFGGRTAEKGDRTGGGGRRGEGVQSGGTESTRIEVIGEGNFKGKQAAV